MKTHPLPVYSQRFFTERHVSQLQTSSHTVASYRATFRLLLTYASDRLGRMPTDLQVADWGGCGLVDRQRCQRHPVAPLLHE